MQKFLSLPFYARVQILNDYRVKLHYIYTFWKSEKPAKYLSFDIQKWSKKKWIRSFTWASRFLSFGHFSC